MADDISVLLAGALRNIAADDLGAPGPERMAQIVEAMGQVYDGFVAGGVSMPRMDPSARLHVLSDGLRKRFKDDFSGAALDPAKWTATLFGGGLYTVAGSVLTLDTGDGVSGSGVELLSVDTYDSPVRLLAIVNSISQRIANQEFSIELVEESTAAGATGTDAAKILFNGTVNTTAQVTTLCTGDQDGPNNWTTDATSGALKFEIDMMPDECWFYDSTLNSVSQRNRYAHQDRKTPDTSKRYRIRLRLRNTGVAASHTTVAIDAVILEDNAYMPVELAHARGSSAGSAPGEGLGVIINNPGITGAVVGVGDKAQWFDETAAALGAAATFTGTARDLAAVATGSTITGFPGVFRALAIQDVVGTLYVEVSADNVTWYRLGDANSKVALAQADATTRFSAFVEVPQVARFARAVVVNGAGAAALTRVFTKMAAMPGS